MVQKRTIGSAWGQETASQVSGMDQGPGRGQKSGMVQEPRRGQEHGMGREPWKGHIKAGDGEGAWQEQLSGRGPA